MRIDRSAGKALLPIHAICALMAAFAVRPTMAGPDILEPPGCRRPATVVAPVGVADLRPGVDAHGRPVDAADLNPPPAWAQNPPIDLRVRADLDGVPAGRGAWLEGSVPIGRVTVEDGRALLDGQPLAADASESLPADCRDAP